MSTAQVDRPAPVLLSRVTRLRHTSPGRLQFILVRLVAIGLLTGLVAGVAAYSAGAGTDDLGDRSQPLLVEAETIYSALADADTTAALAFLTGGLEPPVLTARYQADLDRATEALTSAARRTPEDGTAADAVRALSSGVPEYAALVATARANNRQGLPIGASYLSAASTKNRTELLPRADELFRAAQRDVDRGYSNARSVILMSLLVLLLIALFATLLRAQRYLSRTHRRTFNVPLVAATGVAMVLTVLAGALVIHQQVRLHGARADGSRPVALLAEARILALRERADEALTLVARGGSGPLEVDFRDTQPLMDAQLKAIGDDWDGRFAQELTARHGRYVAEHVKLRALDDSGDYDGAVAAAVGAQTTTPFTALTDSIGTALEERKDSFAADIGSAGRGLGLLAVAGPVLALLICVLALAGIRARLEEYR